MKKPFREFHLLTILNNFEKQNYPLDFFLRNYFREHKSVGSHDRKFICEKLYNMIRWRGLIDQFCKKPITWEERLRVVDEVLDRKEYLNSSLPPHVRVSFPKWYYEKLKSSFGEDKALQLCLNSNQEAPTTIRVNILKISRNDLFNKWKEIYPIRLCEKSPVGITFSQRINFFALPEFKEGLFEVQDEASQLVADLVDAKPGDQVLDYCSGSGGKTLAFAPKMEHKGQIFLHDIRPHALLEAKKRLKRAGIQNAQVVMPDSPYLKKLERSMDWVLVDAPCSGSGTLRRNPDMKWKFENSNLENLIKEQREITAKASIYLRKGGKLVYATCSVFPEENENQVNYFLEHLPLKLCKEPFRTFPEEGKMDGFFAAVFEMP